MSESEQEPFDLHDFFGRMAQRPDSPEFWRLSQVMLGHDAQAEGRSKMSPAERDAAYEAAVRKAMGDPQALTYMAFQRALPLLGISTKGELAALMLHDPERFYRLVTAFMDGFMIGVAYQREATS